MSEKEITNPAGVTFSVRTLGFARFRSQGLHAGREKLGRSIHAPPPTSASSRRSSHSMGLTKSPAAKTVLGLLAPNGSRWSRIRVPFSDSRPQAAQRTGHFIALRRFCLVIRTYARPFPMARAHLPIMAERRKRSGLVSGSRFTSAIDLASSSFRIEGVWNGNRKHISHTGNGSWGGALARCRTCSEVVLPQSSHFGLFALRPAQIRKGKAINHTTARKTTVPIIAPQAPFQFR
jgi:hypothetical protein